MKRLSQNLLLESLCSVDSYHTQVLGKEIISDFLALKAGYRLNSGGHLIEIAIFFLIIKPLIATFAISVGLPSNKVAIILWQLSKKKNRYRF